MAMQAPLRPQNFPEQVVWYTLIGTYGLYYLGAQFVWVPLMAWGLTIYLLWQWWNEPPNLPRSQQIILASPVLIWIVAMLGIEVALVMGHANLDLGMTLMAKSTLNRWMRQWALFALFPLLGCLPIRPQLVIRGVTILCIQSLGLACLAVVVVLILKRPEIEYLSPLNVFGGGELFYSVKLLGSEIGYGEFRLQLFAPWAPALGLVGNLCFWIICQERHRLLRWLGLLGAVVMILGSVSRMAMVALPLIGCFLFLFQRRLSPPLYWGLGGLTFVGSLLVAPLLNGFEEFKIRFNQARAGSSKTRFALQQLALDRWWSDAPIWGHGTIEAEGPRVVGFMPIGSHHQWFGVLFSHGAVGLVCLASAYLWSFGFLLLQCGSSALARTAIALLLTFFLFTWGENLETMAYILWPALLMMGFAYRQQEVMES
jgi:hypothetical protein